MTDDPAAGRADRPSRIPRLATRAEAAAWWDGHDASDYLGELEPVTVRFAKRLAPELAIRLTPEELIELRFRAGVEGRSAPALARSWIRERLDRLKDGDRGRR